MFKRSVMFWYKSWNLRCYSCIQFDVQRTIEWWVGFLLMDASNAFNSVNRAAAIRNSRIVWSSCSRYIFNAYRGYDIFFIAGSKPYILSREGVRQGDPLAMLVYGIAILPPTKKLKNMKSGDRIGIRTTCLAKFKELKEWLELFIQEGPKYGHFP